MKAHIISHTHWDREWFLNSKYTNEWLIPFFDSLFNYLDKYPEYYFVLDGQTLMIEDYLEQLSDEERNKSENKFKKYIGQSRLLVGPYYLQPDWNLVSGESLVRNILIGHRIAKRFGRVMKAGWLLDNFGQISQAPQIHRGFNIDGVYLWRGVEIDPNDIHSEYYWKSPDGSQVISIYLLSSYRNAMRLSGYSEIAQNRIETEVKKLSPFATTDNVLLMNGYDQEMEPDDVLPLIKNINSDMEDIKLIQTTPEKYLETIQEKNPALVVLKGAQNSGRYISVFPGVLSARMYLKQMNKKCENQLLKWAEPMSILLWTLGGEYPQQAIDLSWKELLKNHPHDSICGVSVDDVHSDMEARFGHSMGISGEIVKQTLEKISGNINTRHEQNLVVFNPSPWKRDAIVKIALKVDGDFSICNFDTNISVLYQIGRKKGDLTNIYFLADSVPGLGYKTYYLHNKKAVVSLQDDMIVSQKDNTMENKYLKVKIEKNGALTIINKVTGCIFKSIAYFEDGADSGDTYNYSYPEEDKIITSLDSDALVTLIESGPLHTVYKIELSMNIPVGLSDDRKQRSMKTRRFPIVTYVKLEAGSRRVDFHTKLKNVTKDHRLRVVFSTYTDAENSVSDRQYDIVESPILFSPYPKALPENIRGIMIGARESVPVTTLPLNSFAYLSGNEGGAAVFTKGLSEYEVTESNKIAITLFRSVGWLARGDLLTRIGDAGPMIFTPEAQCLRHFDLHYSFMPFANENTGLLFKQAEQYNAGLKTVLTGKHSRNLKNEMGLFTLKSKNDGLVVTAIKKGEDEDKVIVRLFNSAENDVEGELKFGIPIKKVEILNLNEEYKEDLFKNINTLFLRVPGKKIVTIGVEFERRIDIHDVYTTKTKMVFLPEPEKEKYLDVDIPVIVSESDIKMEKERACQLNEKVIRLKNEMKEIEQKILQDKGNQKLISLNNAIFGELATFTRAELEALLSFTLTQKKYIELYEKDVQKKNEKMKTFDEAIREIGLALNYARITKRVSEYLVNIPGKLKR